jgi:5-methylcytosine-specific restriction protein A
MSSATVEMALFIQSCMDQIVATLRGAARVEDDGLGPDDLTDVLKSAFSQRNRLDSALTGLIGTLDRVAERAPDGESTAGLSCATWLSQNLHISSSAGYAQVRLARQLPSLLDTAAAFERGELSPQHAGVVARSVEMVTRGGGDAADAEGMLLEEARQRDPRDLFRWGLSLVHQLAPEEMEAEEERREERRYLRLTEAFDGGYDIEGYLDPERGARLKTAINGVLGPRRKGDQRTPSQRRADGLVELADRVMDRGELPARGGQKPHLTITASLQTLRADPGAPAALLDWGFPISGKALRRIAADAEITPILLGTNGDPLRVGRRYRTATSKMSRALAERDRRCVWPGCPDPPDWCQRHHAERPWALGGETEVEGMALLCLPHHRKLERGWRLERLPDGRRIAHPPRRPGPVWGPAVHGPPASAGP